MSSTTLPSLLLHYTSPSAALSILEKGNLRATMVHYMNDSREFQYSLDLASEILTEELGSGDDADEYKAVCEEFLLRIRKLAIFAISFSANDDDLSQWRAYCPVEGGHALEFDPERLESTGESAGFKLRPCIYERTLQIEMLRPLVQEWLGLVRSFGVGYTTSRDLYDMFAEQIALVGAQLKDSAFQAENEWRLIASQVKGRKICFYSKRALIVPYLELSLPTVASPMTGMLVGPHRHPELASRSVRLLTAQRFKWPYKVRESKIPFRSLD